jgi:heme/copper-type cytochrome/quinol oxidase subunit 4
VDSLGDLGGFLVQYARLIRQMSAALPAGDPYSIRANLPTVLASFRYYTSLIFHVEMNPSKGYLVLALALAMASYAIYRRHRWILWTLAAYVLTLLPVSVIPGNRAPFYVYAPALFILSAVALTVDDIIHLLTKNEHTRWAVASAAVVVVLISVALFQRGPYFLNRVGYTLAARRISVVTARDVSELLPSIHPDSWLYIYYSGELPWLLVPGPCDFLNLSTRRHAFTCVLSNSRDEIGRLYVAHASPKYYMVYGADGSLRRASVSEYPTAVR